MLYCRFCTCGRLTYIYGFVIGAIACGLSLGILYQHFDGRKWYYYVNFAVVLYMVCVVVYKLYMVERMTAHSVMMGVYRIILGFY